MAAPAPPRPVVMARQHHSRTNSAASGGQHQRPPTQILTPARAAPARLKVHIRRLPPGLTQAEFSKALGDEWRVGGERVDWLSFKEGKVSKELAKQSRPGRAYFHLTKSEFLAPLSTVIRECGFTDARNTGNDACLLGPPSLEFSPYGRVPTAKPRKDARQGTIDQDMEFIDFLQELTNPVVKSAPLDGGDKENNPAGETVTPLVQYLRDKKANKGKENAPTKNGKQTRQETKDSKAKSNEKGSKAKDAKEPLAPTIEKKSASAAKVEKIARDAVKVLNKQAAAIQKPTPQGAASNQAAKTQAIAAENSRPTPPIAPTERKRGKVGVEAKNLLQRDLGLGGGGGGRRRRGEAATAGSTQGIGANAGNAQTKTPQTPAAQTADAPKVTSDTASKATAPSNNAPSAPGQTQPKTQPPTGPAASRNQQTKNPPAPAALKNTPSTPQTTSGAQPSVPTASSAPSTPSTPSTQAFLKHANPSQGITEPLLQAAFASFGNIKKVEIDKKKGFAYIDFVEAESLRKAISASPVKVAEGQVVVLERKETKPSTQSSRPRGGRVPGRARGGGGRGAGSKAEKAAPAASATGTAAEKKASAAASAAESKT